MLMQKIEKTYKTKLLFAVGKNWRVYIMQANDCNWIVYENIAQNTIYIDNCLFETKATEIIKNILPNKSISDIENRLDVSALINQVSDIKWIVANFMVKLMNEIYEEEYVK